MKRFLSLISLLLLLALPVQLALPAPGLAFPSTSVLATFDIANENPLSNGGTFSHGILFGDTAVYQVLSNLAAPTATVNSSPYWTGGSFTDSEAGYTVTTMGGEILIYARVTSPGVDGGTDGYRITIDTPTWTIQRIDNQYTAVTLGSTVSQAVTSGDSIGIEIIGTTIKAWFKDSAGAWTEMASRTDATYAGPGRIGFQTNSSTLLRINDFFGGEVVAGAPSTCRGGLMLLGVGGC